MQVDSFLVGERSVPTLDKLAAREFWNTEIELSKAIENIFTSHPAKHPTVISKMCSAFTLESCYFNSAVTTIQMDVGMSGHDAKTVAVRLFQDDQMVTVFAVDYDGPGPLACRFSSLYGPFLSDYFY